MAATRAQAEASNSAPAATPAKNVNTTPAATPSTPTAEGSAPTRRTTTRTRKVPSRLLPSPSPPPSRPSSYHNPSKAARSGKEGGANAPSTPASQPVGGSGSVSTRAKKSARHSSGSAVTPSAAAAEQAVPTKNDAQRSSSSALTDGDDEASAETLGLGKRKRRPSSMIQAPSTLTTQDVASPIASAVGKSKKKADSTATEADADQRAAEAGGKATASGGGHRQRGRLPKGSTDKRSALSALREEDADDSDGGICAAGSAMEDSDMELDAPKLDLRLLGPLGAHPLSTTLQDAELSPPPLLPRCGPSNRIRIPKELSQPATFTKGGLVSVSPESTTKKARLGLQGFGGQLSTSWLAHKRQPGSPAGVSAGQGPAFMPQPPWRAQEDGPDANEGFLTVYGPAPRPLSRSQRDAAGSQFQDEAMFTDNGSDADEDEDDFHQAMLDGDFDMFDSQKSEAAHGPTWPHHLDHRGDSSYTDDTPATTPRSPQSHCGMSMPDSPGSTNGDSKPKAERKASNVSKSSGDVFTSVQDAVFAHALPTTLVGADKPHQHAGSLTLSLPYSPDVAASPTLKNADAKAPANGAPDKTGPSADAFATPIVSRRLHVPGSEARGGESMVMRFNGLGEDGASASHFLQFSPGIEIESPILGPTLAIDMASSKPSQPTSPFIMGVSNEATLDIPAPMSLTEPQAQKEAVVPKPGVATPTVTGKPAAPSVKQTSVVGSTLAPAPNSKTSQKTPPAPAPTASKPSTSAATKTPATGQTSVSPPTAMPVPSCSLATPAPSAPAPLAKAAVTAASTPSTTTASTTSVARRTAPNHPPPRHISFTVRSVDPLPTPPGRARMVLPPRVAMTPPVRKTVGTPAVDRTPELVYSGGSASSEASSGSASPASRTDSDMAADAEVEHLLFGPPEKLDLRELDSVWGPSSQAESVSAQKANIGGAAAPSRQAAAIKPDHASLAPM